MSSSKIETSSSDAKDSKNTYTKPVLQKLDTESNEGKTQPSPFEVPAAPGSPETVGS